MRLHYRVEICGPLSRGVAEELHRRFGQFSQHREGGRTVLSDLVLDQAGLRALLGLLWDLDSELHLVSAESKQGGTTPLEPPAPRRSTHGRAAKPVSED